MSKPMTTLPVPLFARQANPLRHEESSVADLLFVVLTVALFAVLTVLVKAAER
ncbi:hypothetical protein [Actinoplanes couchii]|uniref:hypothetical protein n=1 Tax=Actinoplanes couchii TaxID=403638 RepID=UPI0019453FD7|nr:hypothetical protein [Actinoplanes couchii]MDR6318699.1 hypothetical protein [Actinoplanes couchii]